MGKSTVHGQKNWWYYYQYMYIKCLLQNTDTDRRTWGQRVPGWEQLSEAAVATVSDVQEHSYWYDIWAQVYRVRQSFCWGIVDTLDWVETLSRCVYQLHSPGQTRGIVGPSEEHEGARTWSHLCGRRKGSGHGGCSYDKPVIQSCVYTTTQSVHKTCRPLTR